MHARSKDPKLQLRAVGVLSPGEKEARMNSVVYACDDNYAPLTAISAVSMLAHNPGLRIILLGHDLRPESVDLVRTRVEKAGGAFLPLDATARIKKLEESGACSYVSYAVYARMFIADLLEEEHGRVLYLDSDTLVAAPIQELFEHPLGSCPVALGFDCAHRRYKKVINLPPEKPYYNSGVMLIDLDAWRRKRCAERLLEELAHPRGRNPLGDQDIIVRVLNDEISPFSPRFNFLSQFLMLDYRGVRGVVGREPRAFTDEADYTASCRAPAIYHFSGNTFGRPWFTCSRHPIRDAYLAAAEQADLGGYARQNRPLALSYRLQYRLWRMLPRPFFSLANRLLLRLHLLLTYHV